ncbi:cupin domain-containing protein [Halobaculum gomorrense]|uniref:Cupin domain protein n=1 Tax=Halobaculum gomorrense TaxID=43928 RepID=A0A1M5TNX9_9EURY|nr:cupin domain-containing protein [Halobaculum gomorrense]SHH52477.1 Cupin domain protein [Halobaculum gomorrense]
MERERHDPSADTEAVHGVHLAQLAAGAETSVQHFSIEPGAEVPAHSHRHEQAGYITAGALTFVLADGEEVVCEAGDSYVLAGEEVHGAENRGDERVEGVDIFSPPRTDPDWQE